MTQTCSSSDIIQVSGNSQDPKNDLKKTFFTPAAKFGYEANVPISRVRLLSFTIGPSHLHSQRRARPELAG